MRGGPRRWGAGSAALRTSGDALGDDDERHDEQQEERAEHHVDELFGRGTPLHQGTAREGAGGEGERRHSTVQDPGEGREALERVVDEGRTERADEQPDGDALHDAVHHEGDGAVRAGEQHEGEHEEQPTGDEHGLPADVVGQRPATSIVTRSPAT